MTTLLQGKHVILGVSGGIAAYKAIELARDLTLAGALVDVMLTRSALEFVRPLPFETLTRRRVYSEVFEPWSDDVHGHVTLGERASAIVIAPATANTIAKLAHGFADDMLTVSVLASPAPLIIAPAMDHFMYIHPAVQANLRLLQERGATIVGPDEGPLASGAVGYGRLVAPERIIGALRALLGRCGRLAGKKVVLSAGPTRESIDPIRFVSNRSSGKMGYALASALIDAGASVTLVSGPTALQPPPEARVIQVESAAQMAEAVTREVEAADVLLMAAAVADYRPATVAEHKIKKQEGELAIVMERTTDILASINRPGLLKVGFAAETRDLLDAARGKLDRKHLDLIIANEVSSTMGSDESQAYFLEPGQEPESLSSMQKDSLADLIVERIADLLDANATTRATT